LGCQYSRHLRPRKYRIFTTLKTNPKFSKEPNLSDFTLESNLAMHESKLYEQYGIGFKILKKAGYKVKKGLGHNLQGEPSPIEIPVKKFIGRCNTCYN